MYIVFGDTYPCTLCVPHIDLLSKQRTHSRKASAKFLQHLKEAIVAENESLEASSDDEDADDHMELEHKDDSSEPIDASTASASDDSEHDNDSLDSVSDNTANTQATIDKYTSMPSPSRSMVENAEKKLSTAFIALKLSMKTFCLVLVLEQMQSRIRMQNR